MKKILFLIVTLLFTVLSHSQITLEETIEKNERINFVTINEETKYFIFDLNTLMLTIYNSDHSIYKTITTDIGNLGFAYNIDDYFVQDFFPVVCLSDKVFDNDNELEFLLFLYGNNTRMLVINEDGSVIFSVNDKRPHFREVFDPQSPSWIKNTNDGIKMILKDENSSENKKYIYSLPGNATLSIGDVDLEKIKLKAFPNPSFDYINLAYRLPDHVDQGKVLVYDLHGRKIKEFQVDTHVSALKLSNEDLTAGTYIYTVVAGTYTSKPLKVIVN